MKNANVKYDYTAIVNRLMDAINARIDIVDVQNKMNLKFEKQVLFRDSSDDRVYIWLCSEGNENPISEKYNTFRLAYDDECYDENTFYAILLSYIMKEKLFIVCKQMPDSDAVTTVKIPNFTNISQLVIKLDMLKPL